MEVFVSNFLDLARLTSDKVVLNLQPLDPRLIVNETLESLRPQTQEKRLHVEVKMDGIPGVQGDEWAIRSLFMNLLTNAVLHGRAGGTIEVGGEEEDDMIRFWIKDDGPGIPEKDLPHIFEQFATSGQLERARSTASASMASSCDSSKNASLSAGDRAPTKRSEREERLQFTVHRLLWLPIGHFTIIPRGSDRWTASELISSTLHPRGHLWHRGRTNWTNLQGETR